jgi:hypothetical protein
MKKRKKTTTTSFFRRFPRLFGVSILLAIVILTVGVVAGISKQRFNAKESDSVARRIPVTNGGSTTNQKVQVEAQTGQIRPLSQEEAQRLAAALKELANQSTAGLKSVHHPDGTVSMDLQGRFQNVALARKNEDGSVSQSCVDNPEAGAAFFGIDPLLVGVKAKIGAAAATNTSPANK